MRVVAGCCRTEETKPCTESSPQTAATTAGQRSKRARRTTQESDNGGATVTENQPEGTRLSGNTEIPLTRSDIPSLFREFLSAVDASRFPRQEPQDNRRASNGNGAGVMALLQQGSSSSLVRSVEAPGASTGRVPQRRQSMETGT